MNMTKQEFSRTRNWMKARITGITFNHSVMSYNEIPIANEIDKLLKQLIKNWDDESRRFGLKVAEYKCYWCRRKAKESNKTIIFGEKEVHLCDKHYQEYQNEINVNTTSD